MDAITKDRQKEFMARTLVGMVMHNQRELTDEECAVYNSILARIESDGERPAPPTESSGIEGYPESVVHSAKGGSIPPTGPPPRLEEINPKERGVNGAIRCLCLVAGELEPGPLLDDYIRAIHILEMNGKP